MPKKVYSVIITLPDLVAAHAEHEIKVESASWNQAIQCACEEVSRHPHVRGKHIKSAKISFRIVAGATLSKATDTASSASPDQEPGQGVLFEI